MAENQGAVHEDRIDSRRVLLINPRFQIGMMCKVAILAAVVIAIFYGANYYFFARFLARGHLLGLPPDHVFFKFITEQRQIMDHIFLITSLSAFIVVFAGGLVLSHRVAGPVYRLRKHMLEVAAGKHTNNVKFRDKDYFPELAEAYNQQIEFLRKK